MVDTFGSIICLHLAVLSKCFLSNDEGSVRQYVCWYKQAIENRKLCLCKLKLLMCLARCIRTIYLSGNDGQIPQAESAVL